MFGAPDPPRGPRPTGAAPASPGLRGDPGAPTARRRSRSRPGGRRMRSMPDVPPRTERFIPQTAPAALEDLRARLRATRWPDTPEDAGWSLGTDLAYLRELVAYWADGFDWPAQEAALARLPGFRVPLGGLGIHFVHVPAAAPAGPVLPLIL